MSVVHIGLDPGLSTGLAVLVNGDLYRIWQGDAQHAMEVLDEVLRHFAPPSNIVHIGTERFVITPQTGRKTQQTDALEVTGTADFIAAKHGVPTPSRQGMVEVKKFAKNELLRSLGLYIRADEIEAPDADDVNDAIRHAVYILAMTNPQLFTQLLRRARVIG